MREPTRVAPWPDPVPADWGDEERIIYGALLAHGNDPTDNLDHVMRDRAVLVFLAAHTDPATMVADIAGQPFPVRARDWHAAIAALMWDRLIYATGPTSYRLTLPPWTLPPNGE